MINWIIKVFCSEKTRRIWEFKKMVKMATGDIGDVYDKLLKAEYYANENGVKIPDSFQELKWSHLKNFAEKWIEFRILDYWQQEKFIEVINSIRYLIEYLEKREKDWYKKVPAINVANHVNIPRASYFGRKPDNFSQLRKMICRDGILREMEKVEYKKGDYKPALEHIKNVKFLAKKGNLKIPEGLNELELKIYLTMAEENLKLFVDKAKKWR